MKFEVDGGFALTSFIWVQLVRFDVNIGAPSIPQYTFFFQTQRLKRIPGDTEETP